MDATERHADLLVQLSEGITALTTSEEWIRYLNVQSRFHRYSFGNVVLIAAQLPGASRVAGFRAWLKLGRSVRKGEKAIWILAPMARKKANEDDAGPDRVIAGFKYVPVFDIAQTEGAELPAPCRKLVGDEPLAHIVGLTEAARSVGFSVESAELTDGVNGDCSFELRRIRVERRNAPAQQVKTLAHEIAHALLHHGRPDRRLAELEAESTAYVVCHHLGLDSGSYTFGYVTTWAGGGGEAVAGIKTSGARIQAAASTIIDLVENDRTERASDAA
jgi:antirestriction protein ArdC